MIEFNVRHQMISRVDDFRPAEKSSKYLIAKFNFNTSDWDNTVKTAIFKNKAQKKEYKVILIDGQCEVPWESISEEGKCEVSVYGVNEKYRITTNIGTFKIYPTLSGGSKIKDLTPSLYEQLLEKIINISKDILVDDEMSISSKNPVQNKVVTEKINQLDEEVTTIKRNIGDVEILLEGI